MRKIYPDIENVSTHLFSSKVLNQKILNKAKIKQSDGELQKDQFNYSSPRANMIKKKIPSSKKLTGERLKLKDLPEYS